MSSERPGILLAVSSPSGAGKTTLCTRLRAEFPRLSFSVSYTTRAPRTGEVDGREYHFVSMERFDEMNYGGEFAESARVHGNMYGTAIQQVESAVAQGHDLLFDIDFQGAQQLASHEVFEQFMTRVFILPPSLQELEQRLRRRATDADEVIERRLRMARMELAHYHEYEYVIVNDDIDSAYDALRAVYLSQLQRVSRQHGAARGLLLDGD